jgi:hypothetical protein
MKLVVSVRRIIGAGFGMVIHWAAALNTESRYSFFRMSFLRGIAMNACFGRMVGIAMVMVNWFMRADSSGSIGCFVSASMAPRRRRNMMLVITAAILDVLIRVTFDGIPEGGIWRIR